MRCWPSTACHWSKSFVHLCRSSHSCTNYAPGTSNGSSLFETKLPQHCKARQLEHQQRLILHHLFIRRTLMSVLRFPRLYFRGEISWDPCLANNLTDLYDAAKVQLVLPEGVTLEQYKQYILSNADTLGIWNYYGTHDARFENVLVTGGSTEPHRPPITDDALVGKRITLHGKLVDVDPTAVHTSQIFFDEISVGDETAGFAGLRVQRMHSRWINFSRNLALLPIAGIAAVAWQTTLAKTDLQF